MVEKNRVSVTLTEPYLDFMSYLVRTGLYFNRATIIMEALRVLADKLGFPLINEEANTP